MALATLALVVGAGCAGDDAEASSSTTTTAPTSTTTTAPTTTGPTTAPPPTEPARPTGYANTAPDAVAELRAAWQAGDVARGEAIAPPEVVAALFPVDSSGWEVYGCQTERPEIVTNRCNWRNRSTGGFIQVNTERFEQGWQVTTIRIGTA